MQISRRRLLLAGVSVFVLGLVVLFPARVAYQWFAPPGVAVSGLSGTVWNGQAAAATVDGLFLRDLAWKFRPQSLLTGKLGYSINAEPATGFIDTELYIALGGKITARDLAASVPLELLAGVLQADGLQGNANARFEELTVRDGTLTAATGTLEVSSLVHPLAGNTPLGGYIAEFTTQDDAVHGSVEDNNGVVDLAGSLRLTPDRRFEFSGLVIASANTPRSLAEQLRFLGPANNRGQHTLEFDGTY